MTRPLRITAHALARFLARMSRPMDGETAKATLEAMAARAHFVRQQGNGELWRVSGSGRKQWDRWRLIVVGGEVVTVLPPFGDGNKKPPPRERERLRRHHGDR